MGNKGSDMKTTISRHIDSPFRITDTHVRGLTDFLTQNVGPTQITAKCEDHAQREFETVEELLTFENVDSQKIHELNISANSNEPSALRVSLDFGSGKTIASLFQMNNIYVHISGTNEQTVYLNGELENKIKTMKPWYSKYTKLQGYHVLLFLLMAVWSGAYYFVWYGFDEYNTAIETKDASLGLSEWVFSHLLGPLALSFLVCLLSYSILETLSKSVMRLRQRYYPSAVFLIGYQLTVDDDIEYKRRAFLRWTWRTLATGIIGILTAFGISW